jgi:hypothetical protein
MLSEPFFQRALLAGIGIALVAGPVGSFIVWRRMAYFGESLAHAALLGVALGLFFGVDVKLGVIASGLTMAGLLVALRTQRMFATDTVIGILSHGALALGLITASFMTWVRIDLMGLLFGDILTVTTADLLWVWVGGAGALGPAGVAVAGPAGDHRARGTGAGRGRAGAAGRGGLHGADRLHHRHRDEDRRHPADHRAAHHPGRGGAPPRHQPGGHGGDRRGGGRRRRGGGPGVLGSRSIRHRGRRSSSWPVRCSRSCWRRPACRPGTCAGRGSSANRAHDFRGTKETP